MASFKFTKKISVTLRSQYSFFQKGKINTGDILEGYTVPKNGFPFAIAKGTEHNQNYWIIINRFSGMPIVYRFDQKQKAEKFFKKFAEIYDIEDIEFKDPLSKFNYKKASFETRKALQQDEYIRRNYGEVI